jgi:hypothetical protein
LRAGPLTVAREDDFEAVFDAGDLELLPDVRGDFEEDLRAAIVYAF